MNQFDMSTSDEKNVCTEAYTTSWYTSVPLSYNAPYMTPFPSYDTDVNNVFGGPQTAQWASSLQGFSGLAIQPISPNHTIERPRSSPSSFGPSANDLQWPENPLGIHFPMTGPQQVLGSTDTTSTVYNAPAEAIATPSPPQKRRSSADTRRTYPLIAPNPASRSNKRGQDEDADGSVGRSNSGKRQRTLSFESPSEQDVLLSDHERLLRDLRAEGLPWKEIRARFESQTGQTINSEATLQMRRTRYNEKLRPWLPEDVEALKKAVEYYEKQKWEIVSKKMLEFGISKKWPAKYCSRKWAELTPTTNLQQQQVQQQPRQQALPQSYPQMGHTPPQQITPRSLQHTPTRNFVTLSESVPYAYPISY